jgi:hypothetical protein
MTTTTCFFNDLSDCQLLEEAQRLAASERQATARLVASPRSSTRGGSSSTKRETWTRRNYSGQQKD